MAQVSQGISQIPEKKQRVEFSTKQDKGTLCFDLFWFVFAIISGIWLKTFCIKL